jgi:hypothetical protein
VERLKKLGRSIERHMSVSRSIKCSSKKQVRKSSVSRDRIISCEGLLINCHELVASS